MAGHRPGVARRTFFVAAGGGGRPGDRSQHSDGGKGGLPGADGGAGARPPAAPAARLPAARGARRGQRGGDGVAASGGFVQANGGDGGLGGGGTDSFGGGGGGGGYGGGGAGTRWTAPPPTDPPPLSAPTGGGVGRGGSSFNAGTNQVNAAGANGPASGASVTITFASPTQAITFDPIPAKTYGDADFPLTADAGGAAVSFSATGNCTTSGSTAHITGAGSCTITASSPGNIGLAPPDVSQTVSIAKHTIPVDATPNALTWTYGGPIPAIPYDAAGERVRAAGHGGDERHHRHAGLPGLGARTSASTRA